MRNKFGEFALRWKTRSRLQFGEIRVPQQTSHNAGVGRCVGNARTLHWVVHQSSFQTVDCGNAGKRHRQLDPARAPRQASATISHLTAPDELVGPISNRSHQAARIAWHSPARSSISAGRSRNGSERERTAKWRISQSTASVLPLPADVPGLLPRCWNSRSTSPAPSRCSRASPSLNLRVDFHYAIGYGNGRTNYIGAPGPHHDCHRRSSSASFYR